MFRPASTGHSMLGWIFGANPLCSEGHVADCEMTKDSVELKLYELKNGNAELLKTSWVDRSIAAYAEETSFVIEVADDLVHVALGDHLHLDYKVRAPVDGCFGPYVSGHTGTGTPFHIHSLRVVDGWSGPIRLREDMAAAKTWFENGRRIWGDGTFVVSDTRITTPYIDFALDPSSRNTGYLSSHPLSANCKISFRFRPARAAHGKLGWILGADADGLAGFIAECDMFADHIDLILYEFRGSSAKEKKRSSVRGMESAYSEETAFEVVVDGRAIHVSFGDSLQVDYTAAAPAAGFFGPYVSANTEMRQPIELNELRVVDGWPSTK